MSEPSKADMALQKGLSPPKNQDHKPGGKKATTKTDEAQGLSRSDQNQKNESGVVNKPTGPDLAPGETSSAPKPKNKLEYRDTKEPSKADMALQKWVSPPEKNQDHKPGVKMVTTKNKHEDRDTKGPSKEEMARQKGFSPTKMNQDHKPGVKMATTKNNHEDRDTKGPSKEYMARQKGFSSPKKNQDHKPGVKKATTKNKHEDRETKGPSKEEMARQKEFSHAKKNQDHNPEVKNESGVLNKRTGPDPAPGETRAAPKPKNKHEDRETKGPSKADMALQKGVSPPKNNQDHKPGVKMATTKTDEAQGLSRSDQNQKNESGVVNKPTGLDPAPLETSAAPKPKNELTDRDTKGPTMADIDTNP